jgi:hypothetical protein
VGMPTSQLSFSRKRVVFVAVDSISNGDTVLAYRQDTSPLNRSNRELKATFLCDSGIKAYR